METEKLIYPHESYGIIGAAMEVHNTLGQGFLESVYQEAMEIELKKRNIPFEPQCKIQIRYKDVCLDHYFIADFVCFDEIIVELKAVTDFCEEHYAQVYNYLKASGMNLGLLINFGKKSLEHKRIPCTQKW